MLITTTNGIGNYEITEYIGVVTANAVARTGFWADLSASWGDWFSGFSTAYQDELDTLKNEVLTKLTRKAKKMKANAIIGLRVDFDEISGQNKQMFMAVMTGTAVYINGLSSEDSTSGEISEEAVHYLIARNDYLEQIQNGSVKALMSMEKIYEYELVEAINNVIDELSAGVTGSFTVMSAENKDKLDQYFSLFDKNELSSKFIDRITQTSVGEQAFTQLVGVMKNYRLGNLTAVENALKNTDLQKKRLGLHLVEVLPAKYSREDAATLIRLAELMKTGFPEVIEWKVPGKKWECSCGRIMNADYESCNKCTTSKRGLTWTDPKPEELAPKLEKRAKVLREYFGEANG
ncbi:YbjQ family protein [Eubacteriales bacterium OttesenSCG-928-K08]|nr:YbjQ family protein [Eubacteriales bacterium OttesenSCG-928-K08]